MRKEQGIGMGQALDVPLEQADNVSDGVRKVMEKIENRFTCNNPRFAERYLKSEIEIRVHLRVCEPRNAGDYCAILKCADFSISKDGNWGTDEDRSHLRIARTSGKIIEVGPINTAGDDEKDLVFVDIVQLVKFPEKIVPTTIRLQSVNDAYRFVADSLFLSWKLVFVLGQSLANRKGDVGSLLAGSVRNQLPEQMVETASQLVDGLGGNNGQFFRHTTPPSDLINSVKSLRVNIDSQNVWVGFAEGFKSEIEITDVVIGPLNFLPHS